MMKRAPKGMPHTGNTIRQFHRHPVLRQYQKYGCMVINNGIESHDIKATKVMKDVLNVLPTTADGVELSLNKQRRWELPSYMKNKTEIESDSKDVQITVLEHRMSVPVFRPIEEWDTCTSYYSNRGVVRECIANTEMNIKSAKHGHREEDHLGKLERRRYKKTKKVFPFDTYIEENPSIPSYECHIVYGAETNGKLYMELGTKGFAQTSKKNRSHTSGCSKRFLSKHQYSEDDLSTYTDDEFDSDEDYTHVTNTIPSISLSDYIIPGKYKRSKPRRTDQNDYVIV